MIAYRPRITPMLLLFFVGVVAAIYTGISLYQLGAAHADTGSGSDSAAVERVTVESRDAAGRPLVYAMSAAPAPTAVDTTPVTVAVIVGALAAILSALSLVLHLIAPRTSNKWDDAASAKVDELLALLRLVPIPAQAAPSTTTVNVTGQPAAAAEPVKMPIPGGGMLFAVLLLGLGAAALPACGHLDTVKADAGAIANGAVTCAKADIPAVKALGLQLATEALVSAMTGHGIPWAQLEAEAEAGAKAQGIAVGSCAFGQLIADLARLLPPPAPVQGLMAATPNDGRAELAALKAHLGVTEIRTADGQVL